jgi:tRNA-specific 2-thiouridylase
MATGHYAAIYKAEDGPALFAGKDPHKEQSYFLALTPLENLSRVIFPLAEIHKGRILDYLARRSIDLPQKAESQEACFIPQADYREFLKDFTAKRGLSLSGPGPIILPDKRVIATHNGLWNYTEGQRHGLGIAWSEPLYVLGKDISGNTLIVGTKSDFSAKVCRCGQLNFLVQPKLWPKTILAKTRYRQKLEPAKVCLDQEKGEAVLELEFLSGEKRPPAAPGQIAAVYSATKKGHRLLAGGVLL